MMAAYSENEEFIDDTELENIIQNKIFNSFFGPTDLSTLDINNAGSTFEIINSLGDKKEEIIQEYSPVNYVGADEPKTLIIHSTEDQLVPYENAESLFKSWLIQK